MAIDIAKVDRVLATNPLRLTLLSFEAPDLYPQLVERLNITEQKAASLFDQVKVYLAIYHYMTSTDIWPFWIPKPNGLPPKLHEVLRIFAELRAKDNGFYDEDPDDWAVADHEARKRRENPDGPDNFFWILHHLQVPYEHDGVPPSAEDLQRIAFTAELIEVPVVKDLWK